MRRLSFQTATSTCIHHNQLQGKHKNSSAGPCFKKKTWIWQGKTVPHVALYETSCVQSSAVRSKCFSNKELMFLAFICRCCFDSRSLWICKEKTHRPFALFLPDSTSQFTPNWIGSCSILTCSSLLCNWLADYFVIAVLHWLPLY